MTQPDFLSNRCIFVDKPVGWSSNRVLTFLKRALGVKRMGHGGTLDPFATGLLLICLGRATRLLPLMNLEPKCYAFDVMWGTATDTGDVTGRVQEKSDKRPAEKDVVAVLEDFRGDVMQIPPVFSALKIKGQRAYRLARQGQQVTLSPRKQHISHLELVSSDKHAARFIVHCNSGTYVRTLGEDIAKALGTYGHVTRLDRFGLGRFRRPLHTLSKSDSDFPLLPLDFFIKNRQPENEFVSFLMSPTDLLDGIPVISLSEHQACDLIHGRRVSIDPPQTPMVFCQAKGHLMALARVVEDGLLPFILLE